MPWPLVAIIVLFVGALILGIVAWAMRGKEF